jgi:hypothetical protein
MNQFRHIKLNFLLAAVFAPFAALILFAAARMPMSYDDAFNAMVPLNLARGNGYASSFVGIEPFDPAISSGAAFLAPAALPIAAFGADMRWPMLYTAALCLTLYLFLLRSLHQHAPPAALATAFLVPFTLWQGKNDTVVPGNILPPPPFGFWYQLLGNLPGVLALALAMSLLLQRGPVTVRRSIAIAMLIAFAVNAKLMHVVPLAAMVVAWVVFPADHPDTAAGATPRLRRLAIALGLLAAGWCGLRFNRILAWLLLDGGAFDTFVGNETAFIDKRSGIATLLSNPLASPRAFVKLIVWNALRSVPFLGVLQAPMMAAGLVATAVIAWRSARQSSVARLALVFLAGAAAHFTWWVCVPSPPTRHLTVVAALACFAMGCGFGLPWGGLGSSTAGTVHRSRIAWGAALGLLCAAGASGPFGALGAWGELREYRSQQQGAAAALDRLAGKYPDAAFCGSGWWVPRELTYLAPAGTEYCDLNAVRHDAAGRRILMLSSNLWPPRKDTVRAAAKRCPIALEQVGRFGFRACDGFRP